MSVLWVLLSHILCSVLLFVILCVYFIFLLQQHGIILFLYYSILYILRWFSTLCSLGKCIVSQYELSLSAFCKLTSKETH